MSAATNRAVPAASESAVSQPRSPTGSGIAFFRPAATRTTPREERNARSRAGACALRPPGRRRRQHRLDLLLVGEVRPPERRAQREPEDRDQAQLEADLGASRPHSQDDDRLAEHDDHDEAVPLDEVRRRDLEALHARDVGHEPEGDRRRDDERPLELVVHEPGRNEHQRGCDVVGNDARIASDSDCDVARM